MAPLREYICNYCNHQFEELVYSQDPDEYKHCICRCGSTAEVLPAMIGGYNGSTGTASTRPKNSACMPSKKAFTKHKGNQGEPETPKDTQLDFFDVLSKD